MNRKEIEYFKYLGAKVHNTNYTRIKNEIEKKIKGKGYISVTSPGTVMMANTDRIHFEAINNSILSIPDGTFLAWYGKLIGCKRIKRVSGPLLMKRMIEEKNCYKHFLVGDTEYTIEKVKETARKKNKDIIIDGYSPPFKDEFDENDNRLMMEKINAYEPDIVWVSFGAGKQEKWMYQNIHMLKKGIMIGVGAAFRFYTKQLYEAPGVVQRLGLQWFSRMLENPAEWLRKLFFKYVLFCIHFPKELLKGMLMMKRYKSQKNP